MSVPCLAMFFFVFILFSVFIIRLMFLYREVNVSTHNSYNVFKTLLYIIYILQSTLIHSLTHSLHPHLFRCDLFRYHAIANGMQNRKPPFLWAKFSSCVPSQKRHRINNQWHCIFVCVCVFSLDFVIHTHFVLGDSVKTNDRWRQSK